jgi:hypothetical protein
MFANGMLEVECYNVFLKAWSRSRKNLGEGLTRLNALCQEVMITSLVTLVTIYVTIITGVLRWPVRGITPPTT